ncbi:coiled coil-containing protein [Cryptosporidium canis]|uniref:Coiled coil-containing protein n=1 Tax=Cryptosporidium canis TaxID=195482 RepID=A0ABQ8PAW9_9CRYT|nr:coiled coil-containing protein [Cryptosporidium canis]KAJ1614475.1 coiled coil-containing protein [Cryptosporidium canis]
MYPLSPRNCFGTSHSSRASSNEILTGLSFAYPNSSNESYIQLRHENSSKLPELDLAKIQIDTSVPDSKGDQHHVSHRTVLKRMDTSHQHDINVMKDKYPSNWQNKNARLDIPVEHCATTDCGLTDSYVNLSRDQLYKIIYQKHDELQQIKLQLNEAKVKELSLGKSYELSIAKQNELKTINTNLENLVNQLRCKKNHQINSIAGKLRLGSHDNAPLKKLEGLGALISELKDATSSITVDDQINESKIKNLKSAIDQLITYENVVHEIEYIEEERQQLIQLLASLNSNNNYYTDNYYCDNELRNENVKQVNISLCDQIRILEFKLKRSNEMHRKKLHKIKNLIETLEKSEMLPSPIIQEIKSEVSHMA